MSKEHSPKEKAVYQAVLELFWEGTDLNSLTVAEITKKAIMALNTNSVTILSPIDIARVSAPTGPPP